MFDFKERNMEENNGCMQALTLVFIENQEIEQVYETDTAFTRGTAFPNLDKPFCPGGLKYER